MPRLPRAILFDLDDTIIQAYGRPELAWSAVIAEYGPLLAPLRESDVLTAVLATTSSFWADPERHRIWRQKLRHARREIVARAFTDMAQRVEKVPSAEVQRRLADRFSDYRDENRRLFPDAHTVIDSLRAQGIRLALVTNGASEDQREKITQFDLAHRFDHIQIEGEYGFGKPEPRAYLHAMSTLGVGAHETWTVGDNLEWEVTAPQQLGIHAIWYDPYGDGLPEDSNARPDRVVRTLSELLE